MKSFIPQLLCAALACCGLAGPAQAALMTMTEEKQFNFIDTLDLHGVGLPDYPLSATGGDWTPYMVFQNFSTGYGTLVAAHWELEMVYGIDLLSSVYSQSTNPNEPVTAIASVGMNVWSRTLLGTGGVTFQDHTEAYGQCTTTLAQGVCHANTTVSGSVLQRIDVIDLHPYLVGITIETQIGISDELWNLPTQGPVDMFSQATFFGLGPDSTKAKLRLVYEYENGDAPTPVPEPGSLALVGLGLAAAWRGRRTPVTGVDAARQES